MTTKQIQKHLASLGYTLDDFVQNEDGSENASVTCNDCGASTSVPLGWLHQLAKHCVTKKPTLKLAE